MSCLALVKGSEVNQDMLEDFIEIHENSIELLQSAPEIMTQFIISCSDGFVDHLPEPVKELSPHMSSSAECFRVIFELPSLRELREKTESEQVQIQQFFDLNDWESGGIAEHNIYVAPRILAVLSKIGIKRKDNAKVSDAIKEIVLSLKRFVENGEQQSKGVECRHGYILYWAIRALKEFEAELKDEEKVVLRKALSHTKFCLFHQLALIFAGDESEFDVVQLAYYLSTSVLYGGYSNGEVIDQAIAVVFENQQRDGTWKLSHPFLQRPEGGVMNCSSVEVPIAIMRMPHFSDLAHKYLKEINNTMGWIKRNFKDIGGYKGWRSDSHAATRPPESWASAQVCEFLDKVCRISERCITFLLLKELHADFKRPEILWPKIIDFQGIKQALKKNIIDPIAKDPEIKPFKKCSILLFGPPGTGKDTITYALAHRVGEWPVVSLTSTDFLVNGPDNIIKTANEIFKKLMLLEKCVIFLNEVDELFVSRIAEQDKLGKFITNSMIPLVEKLKKNGKAVFVIATNHVERFESAVKRRGRFDLVLPVGPPELKEKVALIKRELSELTSQDIEDIATSMDRKMTIREIIGICDLAREHKGEIDIKELAIEKAMEINQKLEIDIDTMSNFERSLKFARLW